jgi:hypothetical protein
MCEVRSREKRAGTKKKKSTMVSSKKKWTVMNPIRRPMKKCNPSSGQNGQLVHWWVLIHSGPNIMVSDKIRVSQFKFSISQFKFRPTLHKEVQLKSSILIGAKFKTNPKGFTLIVKAKIEKIFSNLPQVTNKC